MRIELHITPGRKIGVIHVDAAHPPRVVRLAKPGGGEHEQYLEWDRAFDDEGQLRHCPVCACQTLFRRSTFPALTGFVMVLVVALVCLLLYGINDAPLPYVAMALGGVIVANLLITLRAGRYLACYRCGSRFMDVKISRDWKEWSASKAQEIAAQAPPTKVQP